MIPRTFPSEFVTPNGKTQAIVYSLPSVSGLKAWIDYIPVKGVANSNTVVENTYAADGYMLVRNLDAISGMTPFKDYIPVYEDATATKPWSTDVGGYIPMYGLFSIQGLFAAGEQGAWYDPSDINLNWRYNLLTYSDQFDNVAWTKTRSTITANTIIAPDDTLSGDKLVEDTSASTNHYINQNLSVTSGSSYVYSVYAKSAGRNVVIEFAASGFGSSKQATFDLSAGTASPLAGVTATITSIGNGWYRCVAICTATATASTTIYAILASGTNPSYTGDGYSGIYIWGAQLEVGTTASTYQRITDGVQDYYTYQAQPVLFQDSAGTTPVTAVEQPVGLLLDKSKGLVLGSELVTNGTFATDITGWTGVGAATKTWDAGRLKGTVSGGSGGSYQDITVVAGKTYSITGVIEVSAVATGSVELSAYDGAAFTTQLANVSKTALGTYSISFVARPTGTTLRIYLFFGASTGTTTGYFDNVSIKELSGNHAFQATSANRPVLSARVNLLTKTEQFDDAAWTKSNATVTANTTTAPNGTVSADRVVFSGAGSIDSPTASLSVINYTGAVYAKSATGSNQTLILSISGGSATTKTVTTEWTQISAPLTGVSGNFSLRIASNSGGADVYLWGADLRPSNVGVNLPAYQRVNTSTDYDTTGFPLYLKFNGTNSSLATNSINFTATDKMTVWAGVRKLSDAASGVVVETSASFAANAGSFLLMTSDGNLPNWTPYLCGTDYTGQRCTTFTAPITNVISVDYDIAQATSDLEISPRINGVIPTKTLITHANAGTGNFGTYPMYIGARAGTSTFFNGQLYSLIVRGAISTSAQITAAETWVNTKTGAY